MSVQEDSVLQLKQELLRSSMAREELEGHNVIYNVIAFYFPLYQIYKGLFANFCFILSFRWN